MSLAIWLVLGRLAERIEPATAARIVPFDTDSRIKDLARRAEKTTEASSLQSLADEVREAIVYDPIDPRLFSVLGYVELQQGLTKEADHHFRLARALSKTDLMSGRYLIASSLQTGKFGEAVRDLDTVLRHRPAEFDALSQYMIPVLNSADGYAAVSQAFKSGSPWIGKLIRYLADNTDGVALAEKLLLDLPPSARSSSDIAAVINGRARRGEFTAAYQFFLFTLSPDESRYSGYIYNPTFSAVALKRPFDWEITKAPGVEVTFLREASGAQRDGVRIRFLEAPVRALGIQQRLSLPPGSYTFDVEVAANKLSLPKGLFWVILCDGKNVLIKLPIDDGTYSNRTFSGLFEVPVGQCADLRLTLSTDLIADTWRHRYEGELSLNSVRILRTGA